MNIIVNGASGYIGYHLTAALINKGHTVYAVCRKNAGLLKHLPRSQRLNIVISQQSDIGKKLSSICPDVWYQTAWEGSLGNMRADPEVQIQNEILSVGAMQTAKDIGCKKIIYTGTVYENISEEILRNPAFDKNSFYILAKKHAYEMTFQLSKRLGIEYVWCRFCQPAGEYMSENQLLPYAIRSFVKNEPTAFGSCSQFFDIISVRYLAEALTVLGEKKCKKNVYYVGSGEPKILREYISKAAEICGYSLDIGFGKRPDDGMVFKKEWFDNSEFVSEFGSINGYSFEDTVSEMAGKYR